MYICVCLCVFSSFSTLPNIKNKRIKFLVPSYLGTNQNLLFHIFTVRPLPFAVTVINPSKRLSSLTFEDLILPSPGRFSICFLDLFDPQQCHKMPFAVITSSLYLFYEFYRFLIYKSFHEISCCKKPQSHSPFLEHRPS